MHYPLMHCRDSQAKVIILKSRSEQFSWKQFKIWAGFELVLGWLAVLKISDWAVKYATFDDNFFMGKKLISFYQKEIL